jgi:CBS domain-containing protein
MKISELMTADVRTVNPEQPIREAAQFMLREDAGVMPVCDGGRLVGMVTDRDIAVRGVAEGLGPDTPVREVMSEDALFCWEDDEVEDVAVQMSDAQVRRFPVVSRETRRLVGIVSLGDLSRGTDDESAEIALEGVSEPGGERSQTEGG